MAAGGLSIIRLRLIRLCMNNMKRHAIIIESGNVKGQDDLPGARLDFSNWLRFLKSELGGAWDEGAEISVFHKPDVAKVKKCLKEHLWDYVFVAFSGHGCQYGESVYVCLNESELTVNERDLTPTYGTVVLDCCRGPGGESGGMVVEAMDSAYGAFSFLDSQSAQSSLLNRYIRRTNIRSAFMREVSRHWSLNKVHMYACAKGQSAEEDSAAGGLYTTMLIGQAKAWGRKVGVGNLSHCYSTLDAHNAVVAELRSLGSRQTPVYVPQNQKYPFAIK